ncbi:SpoIIE family protein phosphatase [Aureibacter tunicatorum]|uniref:Serine phosphatase RsbU (Regulator of sigma subunit) n=1 Tax=Aureibacter tunicatorum TaxID=866807 RepID=A0AAE3XP66_9BACT|nr:SpoIIE family protein phosphatase [Aureibacter tunicatorum]MDR6238714.1 serine phosphatase RsbU (regulator of sigma subunit) [Aureibacter tunicatorum]BDD05355.1 hypothetical protein AUTU_28380 [Aureibacter tunicatorum]
MILRSLFILLFVFCCDFASVLFANPAGTNRPSVFYDFKDNKFNPQSYEVNQALSGEIYMANHDGIISFDGHRWNLFMEMPDNQKVRSIVFNDQGKCFIGASHDFGYMDFDKNGKPYFVSLLHHIPESITENLEPITSVESTGRYVYFNLIGHVAVWDEQEKEMTLLKGRFIHQFFKMDGEVWGTDVLKGVFRMDGVNMNYILEDVKPFFLRHTPIAIMAYDAHRVLTVNMRLEMFLINTLDGTYEPFDYNFKKEMKKASLNKGMKLMDGTFMVSSENEGVFRFDRNGQLIERLGREEGLPSEVVFDLFQDESFNVWVLTSKGVMCYDMDANFQILDTSSGLYGLIYDMAEGYDNDLYVVTSEGLFLKDTSRQDQRVSFVKVDELGDRGYSMKVTPEGLIFSGKNTHIYRKGEQPKRISKLYVEYLVDFEVDGELYILGSDPNRVLLLHFNRKKSEWENLWESSYMQGDFDFPVVRVLEDNTVECWFVSNTRVKKMNIDLETIHEVKVPKFEFFGEDEGVKKNESYKLLNAKGQILLYNNEKICEFNEQYNKFLLNRYLSDKIRLASVSQDGDKLILVKNYDDQLSGVLAYDFVSQKMSVIAEIPNSQVGVIRQINLTNKGGLYVMGHGGFDILKMQVDTGDYRPVQRTVKNAVNLKIKSIETALANYQEFGERLTLPIEENKFTIKYTAFPFNDPKQFRYYTQLVGHEHTWQEMNENPEVLYANLFEGDYLFKVKAVSSYGDVSEIVTIPITITPPSSRSALAILLYFIIAIIFMVTVAYLYSYKLKMDKERLEKQVSIRTSELEFQKEVLKQKTNLLKSANTQILSKNNEISQGLIAAAQLQSTLLPELEKLKESCDDAFVFFRPKDTVSGDIYWMGRENGKFYLACIDCTGHGVSGALLAVMTNVFLSEAIRNKRLSLVQKIEKIDSNLRNIMRQDHKYHNNEGMDIGLVCWDYETMKMHYAGAKVNLMYFKNRKLNEIKADRISIGDVSGNKDYLMTEHELDMNEVEQFYLSTDGLRDQFGGTKGKKFLNRRIRELLYKIKDLPMDKQHEQVQKTLNYWKGNWEQVDDILLIGIKF